jgi:hypothetical protein
MDDLIIINKLQKIIKATIQSITEAMISGGVDNMEKIQVYVRSGTRIPNHITGNL